MNQSSDLQQLSRRRARRGWYIVAPIGMMFIVSVVIGRTGALEWSNNLWVVDHRGRLTCHSLTLCFGDNLNSFSWDLCPAWSGQILPQFKTTPNRVGTGDFTTIIFPMNFFLAAGFVLVFWLNYRVRPVPGHCPHCGYDLTGCTSARCPECGAVRNE